MAIRKIGRLEAGALYEYALRALGRRALSAGELRQRLRARAQEEGDVETTILKLKEYGFLDDKRFAELYANWRLENQGFGRQRVLRDLRQRRVAPAVADKAVEKTFTATNEVDLIEEFLRRKFRGARLGEYLAEPKNLAAAYRKLRHAGYSGGNAIRVLRRYSKQADELEETVDAPE